MTPFCGGQAIKGRGGIKLLEWLAEHGIYGWGHLVQVVVFIFAWLLVVGTAIPGSVRETVRIWQEIKKEEASSPQQRKASKPITPIFSVSRTAEDVKEAEN